MLLRESTPYQPEQTQLAGEQHLLHVAGVPAGEQAFAGNATLTRFLLFEAVERDVAQDGEILRGLVLALSAFIFTEGNVECPMQRVLDAPMC